MMKNILILICLTLIVQANSNNISLNKFALKVANHNNINIYLDENVSFPNVSLFVPDKISNDELFDMFLKTVHKSNFNLKKIGKTYYLSKKLPFLNHYYFYKLKFDTFNDCEALLKSLGVTYTYLSDLNGFMITTKNTKYNKIKLLLDETDKKQSQVMLRLTILEFSDNTLKERGVQFGSIYKGISGSVQTALNTIIAPITSNNPLLFGADFYSAIRLLNEDKLIKVKQNPFILAKHNQDFKFEAVQNIPYLVTTTKTEAANTSEQNSIEYKDVGLKINGKAFIHKDSISLNIDLVIEDLLNDSTSDTMPQTYKRVLKSNTNIAFGKVLLLSGLKRNKKTVNEWKIPLFSDIPYLGEIFKYHHNSNEQTEITIAIEVINTHTIVNLDR